MADLICIKCPIGCHMRAEMEDGELRLTGNTCKKGKQYAQEELTAPKRIVTCLLSVEGGDQPLSVKTASGVPKEKIFDCIREIKSLKLSAPVPIGKVLIENILGTGDNVIATKTVLRQQGDTDPCKITFPKVL